MIITIDRTANTKKFQVGQKLKEGEAQVKWTQWTFPKLLTQAVARQWLLGKCGNNPLTPHLVVIFDTFNPGDVIYKGHSMTRQDVANWKGGRLIERG